MSQNEWKTTEIRASKVGNFSPFSCPGACAALEAALDASTASVDISDRRFVAEFALLDARIDDGHASASVVARRSLLYRAGQEKVDSTSLQRECFRSNAREESIHASSSPREMIARPKN